MHPFFFFLRNPFFLKMFLPVLIALIISAASYWRGFTKASRQYEAEKAYLENENSILNSNIELKNEQIKKQGKNAKKAANIKSSLSTAAAARAYLLRDFPEDEE